MKNKLLVFSFFSIASINLYGMPWFACSASKKSASKTIEKKESSEEKEMKTLSHENKKLVLINALLQHENETNYKNNMALKAQLKEAAEEKEKLQRRESIILVSLEEHHLALRKKTYRPSSRVPVTISTAFTKSEKKFVKDWKKSGIAKKEYPRVTAIKTESF